MPENASWLQRSGRAFGLLQSGRLESKVGVAPCVFWGLQSKHCWLSAHQCRPGTVNGNKDQTVRGALVPFQVVLWVRLLALCPHLLFCCRMTRCMCRLLCILCRTSRCPPQSFVARPSLHWEPSGCFSPRLGRVSH